MHCDNCKLLSSEILGLKLKLGNVKNWINEKFGVNIPPCFEVDQNLGLEKRTNDPENNSSTTFLMKSCLQKDLIIRVEKLPILFGPEATSYLSNIDPSFNLNIGDIDHTRNVYSDDETIFGDEDNDNNFLMDVISEQNHQDQDTIDQTQNFFTINNKRINLSEVKFNKDSKCEVCGRPNFANKIEYYTHLTSHDSSKLFLCVNCSARFPSSAKLRQHFLRCTNKRDFKCSSCPRQYISGELLRVHNLKPCQKVSEKILGPPYKCPYSNCDKYYTSKMALRSHMKISVLHRKHPPRPKPKIYKCEHCKLRISTPAGLALHTKRCLKIKDILCTNCGKLFSSVHDMNLHVKRVHQKIKNKECPHCQKHFHSATTLGKHILSVHSTDPKSLERICPTCGIILKTEDSLKKHIYSIHRDRRFKCEVDGCTRTQAFRWEHEKIRHIKYQHSEINQGPFKCTFDDNCKRGFISQNSLNIHMIHYHKSSIKKDKKIAKKRVTSNEPRVKRPRIRRTSMRECLICKKQIKVFSDSKLPDNLKKHIRFTHEGYRPYKCSAENCNKVFALKANFGYHVKKHHPEQFKPEDFPPAVSNPNPKKYICKDKDCNRVFTSLPILIQHKSVHLKIGEFSCKFPDCKLKFKRNANVIDHIQAVHSGLKPFVCNYANCDKSFALKYYLKSHISSVHLGKSRYKLKKSRKQATE